VTAADCSVGAVSGNEGGQAYHDQWERPDRPERLLESGAFMPAIVAEAELKGNRG
jgi:hypothetical protein